MIRPARAEDRPAAGRLWAESWRAAHAGAVSPAYAAAQTPRLYAEQLLAPGIEAYVEEADGVLRGVLRLDTAAGEVQTLYVAPDCQGRGVGGALLRFGVGRLLALGRRPWLGVLSVNARARAVYGHCGFRPTGEEIVPDKARDIRELRYRYEEL